MLCNKSEIYNDGRHKYLLCKETKNVCALSRWCVIDNCSKMIDGYENKCRLMLDK